jgi:hypothetical protein
MVIYLYHLKKTARYFSRGTESFCIDISNLWEDLWLYIFIYSWHCQSFKKIYSSWCVLAFLQWLITLNLFHLVVLHMSSLVQYLFKSFACLSYFAVDLWQFLIYCGFKYFVKFMILKYIFSVCSLFFHYLTMSYKAKFF